MTPCSTVQSLTFEGAASVISTRFGAEAATITTSGDFFRGFSYQETRASAILEADFGDGSTLAVTATSEPDSDEVQVDIVSDGVAVSFTDEYAFEARVYAATLF